MNRRDMLKALPATSAALALPAAAAQADEHEGRTRVERMFATWQQMREHHHGPASDQLSDEEYDLQAFRLRGFASAIFTMAAVSQRDLLLKMIVATDWGDEDLPAANAEPVFWNEAAA